MIPEGEEEYYNYLIYFIGALIIIAALVLIIRKAKAKKPLKKIEGDESLRYWLEGRLKTGENPTLLKKALERQGSDPKIVDEIMQKIWKSSAEVV